MRTKTWTISDEFWEKIKSEILDTRTKRETGRTYRRKPGGGRKPVDPRPTLEGILYVLRTGCQWNAVPREYGSSSSLHRYFQAWAQAGFFERIWALGLQTYDDMEGIGWEWQSIDGSLVKAPLALEAVGNNPTDRGKKGTKRSLLVEQHGLPIAIQIDGANRHDVKLLARTLDAIVIERPQEDAMAPQHLCADAGYRGQPAQAQIKERKYVPHVRSRSEEHQVKQAGKQARRWVVEVAFSWLNRFRKLLVRFEKKACNYEALLHFACALIVWRKVIPVHSR